MGKTCSPRTRRDKKPPPARHSADVPPPPVVNVQTTNQLAMNIQIATITGTLEVVTYEGGTLILP